LSIILLSFAPLETRRTKSLTGFALIKQHCMPPTCASRSSTNLFGGVENNLFAPFVFV